MGVIYDPILGELRTKDSGGGGGLFEVVESRAMSGNAVEIFTTGTNDDIMFLFEDVNLNSSSYIKIQLSVDAGVSYPSTHDFIGNNQLDTSAITKTASFNLAQVWTLAGWASKLQQGHISLNRVTQTGVETDFDYLFWGSEVFPHLARAEGSGIFRTTGAVDRVKFTGSVAIDSGTIHHLKRTI